VMFVLLQYFVAGVQVCIGGLVYNSADFGCGQSNGTPQCLQPVAMVS
jgi:hypothetical protein